MPNNFRRQTLATPRLAVIVPWMGNTNLYEDSLASILRHRPDHCEVLVPHDDRFSDRHGLDSEVRFCPVDGCQNNRADQLVVYLNRALRLCSAPVVNLIRPGIEVHEGWCDEALDMLLGDARLGSVTTPIQTPSRKRVLQGIQWRSANVDGPSSWCAFYARHAMDLIADGSGWVSSEGIGDDCLDVDIALALSQLGFKHRVAETPVWSELSPSSLSPRADVSAEWARLAKRHPVIGISKSPAGWRGLVKGWARKIWPRPSTSARIAERWQKVDQQFAARLHESSMILRENPGLMVAGALGGSRRAA